MTDVGGVERYVGVHKAAVELKLVGYLGAPILGRGFGEHLFWLITSIVTQLYFLFLILLSSYVVKFMIL